MVVAPAGQFAGEFLFAAKSSNTMRYAAAGSSFLNCTVQARVLPDWLMGPHPLREFSEVSFPFASFATSHGDHWV
jgi:hypothetical protein